MRILVIGGTYFLGKAFVDEVCRDNEVVLINRGSRKVSFPYPAHISHIVSDRHDIDKAMLSEYIADGFDCVVDFCAYTEGDIESVVRAIDGKTSQYIFVSTSDVYKRGTGKPVDEEGELETRDFGGQAGEYILGKVKLEKELCRVAEEYGIAFNSVRPAFIYGPGNYAAREEIFFNWAEKAGQIIIPEDGDGHFQAVYVKDLAKVILGIIGETKCKNTCFNIVGEKCYSYQDFHKALEYGMGMNIEKVMVSVAEINERQIPLPFPLTQNESETYVTIHSGKLNANYTSLGQGIRETYQERRKQEVLNTVDSLFDENKPKDAESYLINMRSVAGREQDQALLLTVLNELIGYYRQTSEKDKLQEIIDASIAAIKVSEESAGSENTLQAATVYLNIANAYRSMGKLEMAMDYYHKTQTIYDKCMEMGQLDRMDMLVAGLCNNMSLLYQEMGDFESAGESLKKALEISLYNKAGFEIAVTYANLANTCLQGKNYEEARDYAYTAIRLSKARGLRDPHYCAALSALAGYHFKNKEYAKAERIYREAAQIVASTIGKNSQYERLMESVANCVSKRTGDDRNGMELSRAYYEAFGAPMIHEKFSEYEDRIAVGLVGEGSDCFGYDDALSRDHDWGPEFCMWLDDATYEEIGEALQAAYEELPDEFEGFSRNTTTFAQGRRGVSRISDFYKKFLGEEIIIVDNSIEDNIIDDIGVKNINFQSIPYYSLAASVNGEVFSDKAGIFSKIRNQLKAGFPERIRLLKVAEAAAGFAQTAQYNYLRMLDREDELTASIMLSDGIKNALKLYHYICNQYPPHDKWLYKSAQNLCMDASKPGDDTFITCIDKVSNSFLTAVDKKKVSEPVEELAAYLARLMYDEEIISDVEPYLDYHTEEILFKAGICELDRKELVDRIVKLEFEAFDKVKNEGGRAYCQNDWPTFSVMRKSQYLTWDSTMLIQYYYDFSREYSRGHNLITEKYGRMMESTDSKRWLEIKENFPELSDEKKAVIEQIVAIQMEMMETFAQIHPKVAGNARTLHTYEDSIIDTSYETYLRGEISTYSDKMLQLYGRYVVMAYQGGVNIAHETMSNTAMLYGFDSLEAFEQV